jgi:transposase
MTVPTDSFATWLAQAQVPEPRLTPEQRGLLLAVFHFRQAQGTDYYSTRLLSHFLLHCASGLKVAQVARLLGLDRTTASRQQAASSKEAIQQAHHRMDGRPYGKLLPRYAGPIAQFLFAHPRARRADLLDFIDHTWGVRVSRVALYHFLKKYGLDQVPADGGVPAAPPVATPAAPPLPLPPSPAAVPELPADRPVPTPAPPFSPRARSTPAPSCSCRRR